jgi:pyroglutamyl-peptidase
VDNEGRTAVELGLPAGEDVEVGLDLEPLVQVLADAGAGEVRISDDAGGYVCERTFRELLLCGRELGVPALFLHVPPAGHLPATLQAPIVRALVERLVNR